MHTASPRSSAAAACSRELRAAAVPRLTGICLAPLSSLRTPRTRNRLSLTRNRGIRPESQTNSAIVIQSACETWWATSTTPPVAGTCSWPRQRRLKNALLIGFTSTTASQIQRPAFLCPGFTPDPPPPHDPAAVAAQSSRPLPPVSTRPAARPRPARVAWGAVRWSVVVPVKRLRLAKSRLYAVGRPRPEHEELALS